MTDKNKELELEAAEFDLVQCEDENSVSSGSPSDICRIRSVRTADPRKFSPSLKIATAGHQPADV